jgi:predicted enzyme related to lactoylglutathione lyase
MENQIKDYDNIFLPSHNLEHAKKFYKDVLGLQLKFDFSERGMIAFKVGNQEPAIIIQGISKFPKAKPSILFVVETVKKTYTELKKKGVKFLSEPYEIFTGMAVQFEELFGNMLGLTDYTKESKK